MTVVIVAGICVLLLVLGFLVPRLSLGPQRGVDRTLGVGEREGGKAPGRLGRLLAWPFRNSRRAADKSAATGRRGRRKLPL